MKRRTLLPPCTDDDELARMRAAVKADAQDRPGVYRMHARSGEVVYVGKSKRLRTRLLSYFRGSYPEDKGARIIREAVHIDWDYTPSEFAALLLEMRQIKRLRPRLNVAMKRDDRHFAFIKISRGTAPKLTVVRGPTEDSAAYYGPFQGAQRVAESLRELNDALGLRDCTVDRRMHFSDQSELFQIARTPGCIRFEIHKCLGPCVGGCSESQYDQRLGLARAFLDCTDDTPLDTLRREMEASSERLEFERAAALRDKVQRLEELRVQFLRLRFGVESLTFVYTVPGHEGDDRVYLIRRGRVRDERPAPRTPNDKRALERAIADVYGPAERPTTRVPTHEIDEMLLLTSWFGRFPEEMERVRQVPHLSVLSRYATVALSATSQEA
jgi:excinuclease ABC subunit C